MSNFNDDNEVDYFYLKVVVSVVWFSLVLLVPAKDSEAVSQWSRKYKVDCSTCHIAFPRLNHFGEAFMKNGFQWPGEPDDGDTEGKEEISDQLFIDEVGNWFGARLSVTPGKFKSSDLSRNGGLQDQVTVGNTNFLQFFVAGSIFKNVSIFIEQEFEVGSSLFNWYHLGFHNLYGSYVNFQVGRISPVDFTPFSDRLRLWAKSDVMNVNSSPGVSTGENSINVRTDRPGIQYYGYKGPLTWFAGLDNGVDTTDTDKAKNYWVGLKAELPDTVKSPFVGSSVGYHFYEGTDNRNTTTAQITNSFYRHTISTNIRLDESWDIQAVYQSGHDENGTLAATAVETDFNGYTLIAGYRDYDWWYILQYDNVNSSDLPSIEKDRISPSAWYFLRDNFKAGLALRLDLGSATVENHEAAFEIRTMF
jgi:hypothetical protein